MKKFFLCICIICCIFLNSCYSISGNIHKISESEFEFRNKNIFEEQREVFGLQVDITIPKTSENYDTSILPNNFIPFTAFKGQGVIYFKAKNIKSFTCYLNEQKVNTHYICKNGLAKIDIGNFVKNGRNVLYISNIVQDKKNASQEMSLNIKIPFPELLHNAGRVAGVSYEALKLIDEIINAEIKNGFPSMQMLIVKDGRVIKNSQYGKIHSGHNAPAVTKNTLYDLASNTKIYATTFAIQRLLYEGKISLHDKVCDYFPEFKDAKRARHKGKGEITIRDLLTHSSGLPAGGAYYTRKKISKYRYNGAKARKETFKLIMDTPLIYTPRTESLYSDINFMLLTFIIEKITESPLDEYVAKKLYKPLGLTRICFKPLDNGFSLDEIAATALGESRHKYGEKSMPFAHGRVHDPESFFSMNEVSGHAGLFANAESIAVMAQLMLNGGGYGSTKLFDLDTINIFSQPSSLDSSHCLGWRRHGEGNYTWAFSSLASKDTIGHTGWTGTFCMIDRAENLIIVILTNAKHSKYIKNLKYEGDYYLAKTYGAFTSIIQMAFNNPTEDLLNSMLVELVEKKYDMIFMDPVFANEGHYKDLNALMTTLKKRSIGSSRLRVFLRSKKGKEIKKFLNDLDDLESLSSIKK